MGTLKKGAGKEKNHLVTIIAIEVSHWASLGKIK
jgi:hypothetical protein